MMNMPWRGHGVSLWGLILFITVTLACGSESRQSNEVESSRGSASPTSARTADLSTPEGPLYVLMKAARENN
ncbi:MAG: hypothetical protein D6723_14725, partial [Acidobacteria bacterium]